MQAKAFRNSGRRQGSVGSYLWPLLWATYALCVDFSFRLCVSACDGMGGAIGLNETWWLSGRPADNRAWRRKIADRKLLVFEAA